MVSRYTKIVGAIAFLAALGCGRGLEKVETIKGPKGDTGAPGQNGGNGANGEKGEKGDRGDKGEQGPVVVQTPQPQPIPVPPIPVPPVIIYPPYPQYPDQCSGCIVVCACLNGAWQTITINVHERYKYNIKNDGACY
jgi:hypothetical protein